MRGEERKKLKQAADSRGVTLEDKGLGPQCWLAWFRGSPADFNSLQVYWSPCLITLGAGKQKVSPLTKFKVLCRCT